MRLLPAGPLTAMPGTILTGEHDLGKLIEELGGLRTTSSSTPLR